MRVVTVSKQTAKNPVARAVAQAKLRSAITNQKICLYLMTNGEHCQGMMEGLSLTLATIGYAATLQRIESTDLSILKGGMSACQQLHAIGAYDPLQTVAIANALDAAERINRTITADNINAAVHILNQGAKQ